MNMIDPLPTVLKKGARNPVYSGTVSMCERVTTRLWIAHP